jgi:hypothetical protein
MGVSAETGRRQPTENGEKTMNAHSTQSRGQKAAETRRRNAEAKAAAEAEAKAAAEAEAAKAAAEAEALEAADEVERSRQSRALAAARVRYERSVAASGRPTQHNGDAVANALRGLWPAEALALAERLCGLEQGALAALYAERNPGSQRMNAGNRVRGWLRREQKAGRGAEALERLLAEAGR